MKITFLLLALVVCAFTYEFSKPKNGTELEETLRSELDDIWVVEWYQNKKSGPVDCSKATATNGDCDCKPDPAKAGQQICTAKAAPAATTPPPAGGAAATAPATPAPAKLTPEKLNELNANILSAIQKQCPTLSKEYKFIQANMDPDLQRNE